MGEDRGSGVERAQRDHIGAGGELSGPGARVGERGQQERGDVDRVRERGGRGVADRDVEAERDVEEQDRERRAPARVPRPGAAEGERKADREQRVAAGLDRQLGRDIDHERQRRRA